MAITPEILEPPDSMVYHKGDTIDFKIKWLMIWGTGQREWIEQYRVNSGDYPPGMHMFKAEGWGRGGKASDIAEALVFAADKGCRVINMSFGSYDSSSLVHEAVEYAYSKGCVLVAAAGDDETFAPMYPAAFDHVIAVSGTDFDDNRYHRSNFGPHIDLSAPAVDVLTIYNQQVPPYGYLDGTSASAALVSGAAALVLSADSSLSPAEVETLLTRYSDDLGPSGWDEFFGFGRLNIYKALTRGVSPAIVGHFASQILTQDGTAHAGKTFDLSVFLTNLGDSVAPNVKAYLSTTDQWTTITQDFSDYGDIVPDAILPGIDSFKVGFGLSMPSGHTVWFFLTIQDNQGMIYTDVFGIKEGEFLSGFTVPSAMKQGILDEMNAGKDVYTPMGDFGYKEWKGAGFGAFDPKEGSSSWYSYQEWWESFCCPAVEHWPINWEYVFARGMPKYVETEVTEPAESTVFHLGDTIRIKVHNLAVWGDTTYAWNEDYVINTSVPSKLGYRYEPDVYTFKPVELDTNWNFVQPADEFRHWWLFELKIKENLVTKYFNPLKPDSARIVFTLQPADYANPDSLPNPISFNVEIRDKDSTLVYGPRPLTSQEQKNQVLYWNGKDNGGQVVDMEQSPYEVRVTVYYQGKGGKFLLGCERKTTVLPGNIEILEMSFSNDNPMWDTTTTNNGWGAGLPIVDPAWKDKGDINKPICYTKNLPLYLTVKLKFSPSSGIPKGLFKMDGPDNLDWQGEITVPGGILEFSLVTSGKLKDKVYYMKPAKFNWSYVVEGRDIVLVSPPTTEHRIYVTFKRPNTDNKTFDNITGENKLTAKRIFALTHSALNANTATEVAEGVYQYSEGMGDNPATDAWPTGTPPIWLVFTGIDGSCIAHSNLMWHGISLLGLAGLPIRIFPSTDYNFNEPEFHNNFQLKFSPDNSGNNPNNFEGACFVAENLRYYAGMVGILTIPGKISEADILKHVALWQAYWDHTIHTPEHPNGWWYDLNQNGNYLPGDVGDKVKFPWEH